MNHRHAYIARVNKVVDHIDAHLAEPLDLQTLASIAHFSPWHFHRVFHALTGETLADRVRRRRLEVAANRLLAQPPEAASIIALDVGFQSAAAFTRAFSAQFGVTPTAWRRGAFRAWAERHRLQLRKIHQADRKAQQAAIEAFLHDRAHWPTASMAPAASMNVEINTFAATRVAYMRHVGPYGESGIPRLWQRFAAWCDANGLTPPRRNTYGIAQDSPDLTAPDKCRYDACIEVDGQFQPRGEIGVQTIPSGRYVCAAFTGTSAEIHAAWSRFWGEWLPDSGYQGDDRPCFEWYDDDFAMDPTSGAFTCRLCIPVRPL